MSKDIHGVTRGKCNACDECEEYMPPEEGHGVRCDYCNHTPVEHVRIIKLGGCTHCGEEECEEYMSGKNNSYTECQYCGCHASLHKGAEKLRKPSKPQPSARQPSQSATGVPGASSSAGVTCKNPGCTRPRYFDQVTGKQHDFCGRTCAQKYQSLQQTGMPMAPPTSSFTRVSGPTYSPSSFTSTMSTTGSSLPGGGLGPSSSGGKPCSKCGQRAANLGHGWCQTCYCASKDTSSASTCSDS